MIRLIALCAAVLPTLAMAQVQVKAPGGRGAILFLQCRACHTIDAGAANKVGPNLHGMFARPPLSAPGFKYSAAFTAAKPKWTATSLDAWLARPGLAIKGTTMAFVGMAKPDDRATLIAWLQQSTK